MCDRDPNALIEDPRTLATRFSRFAGHSTTTHALTTTGSRRPVSTRWRSGATSSTPKTRYRSQLDRIQYPQHRNTTAGVHVHVGVDDADKAVWIANELRWYVPIMLALSANSPYWNGFDTGLQSARAKIFEALPNTGMPTYFEDFEAFDRFERRMLETDSISDRVNSGTTFGRTHGTVELRTPDGQADPEIVLAFVEYAHALVCTLAEGTRTVRVGWRRTTGVNS